MLVFWIAAAFLAAGASTLILARVAGARAGAASADVSDPTVAVYRRALAEIDDLAARDLLGEAERRAARLEAGRRLIGAAATAPPRPSRASRPTLILAAAAPPLLALLVYLASGSPGYADQPFDRRLAAWRAHPQTDDDARLAAVLRAVATERPHDPQPLTRLAQIDLAMGDADGAIHALRRAVAMAPNRPDLLAPLGEVMTLRAGGVVGADAQAVFRRVLALDPGSAAARYYLARARIAGGDVAAGLDEWRALLSDLAAQDPRRASLAADIAAVEKTGALTSPRIDSTPPPDGMAIEAMVQGLAARLEAHPDDPDGWIRLVRAYGVLGERRERDAALAAARRRYVSRPDILARLAVAAAAS